MTGRTPLPEIEAKVVEEMRSWFAAGIDDEHANAEFGRRLARDIIADTLDWAAHEMRHAGPTIAAIMLEDRAERVRETVPDAA